MHYRVQIHLEDSSTTTDITTSGQCAANEIESEVYGAAESALASALRSLEQPDSIRLVREG